MDNAEDYIKSFDKQAWETCDTAFFMLMALAHFEFEDTKTVRLYACSCVRHTPLSDGRYVWDLLYNSENKDCISVSIQYAQGLATIADLKRARDRSKIIAHDSAAHAATYCARGYDTNINSVCEAANIARYQAANAAINASFPTKKAMLDAKKVKNFIATTEKFQADLLRKFISWEDIEHLSNFIKEAKHG